LRDHRAIDDETFFFIRRTRARPPGHAGDDARRDTYGTALEQFEELLGAAATASPGVRPLPLFYALSQAGRAIAAAYLAHDWKLHGHGISCGELSVDNVLQLEIKPWKDADRSEPDSFHSVTQATACEAPTEAMKLGALWSALPQVSRLIADVPEVKQWPDALVVLEHDDEVMSPLWDPTRVKAGLLSTRYPIGSFALENALDRYPNSGCVVARRTDGSIAQFHTPRGPVLDIYWPADTPDLPGRRTTLDRIAPSAPGGDRWWRPRVGGAEMNDLMMWWALLFGLSMLARYEPAGWNGMLDLDHNPIAAHLIRLMDAAVDVVPELVLRVLEPSYVAALSPRESELGGQRP
jgi:hypothetical protein